MCDHCNKRPAAFECRGDGPLMPEHLKHEPHLSCWECDRGNGCVMVSGKVFPKERKG
jgi:hypothetical protein